VHVAATLRQQHQHRGRVRRRPTVLGSMWERREEERRALTEGDLVSGGDGARD
jgi:hypothetical protein